MAHALSHAPSSRRRIKGSEVRSPMAKARTGPSTVVRQLQNSVGNHATQILLARGLLQPKLRIGPVDDAYEREADRTADRVMRMPDPHLDQARPLESPNGEVQRMCSECEEEEKEEGSVQRKPRLSGASPVKSSLESRISSLRGGGQPLPPAARSFFEPRFGHDFSHVRLHTGATAAGAAAAINARAFTLGRDIVFGDGEYAFEHRTGRNLLAHELTHVIQQRTANARFVASDLSSRPGRAPGQVSRIANSSPRNVVQRVPGIDAEDSWASVVSETVEPTEDDRDTRAQEAIRRFLALGTGQQLINEVWQRLCGPRRTTACETPPVGVKFVDNHPEGFDAASGKFEELGGNRYNVYVKNRMPAPPGSPGFTIGGEWGSGVFGVHWTHTDIESSMANTLYHELLHVWFVNTPSAVRIGYRTGHQDPQAGEIEPVFSRAYQRFVTDLRTLEVQIRGEAEARRREEEERRAATPAPPSRAPVPSPEAESGPSIIGGEVSVRGGGAGGGPLPGSGVAIIGADVVLNTIASLRLGVRGVYLTPDHLLAGGTIGLRVLEGDEPVPGRRGVDNPLFFDIEAGILAELTPSDTGRITDHLAGFGSLGVGQEFGRQGPRFFWRVGGFIVISDREVPGTGRVAGGGTGAVGARF